MESCSFELSFELGLCWSLAYRAGEVTLRVICEVGKGTGLPLELFFVLESEKCGCQQKNVVKLMGCTGEYI